jgi:hypothetical protein
MEIMPAADTGLDHGVPQNLARVVGLLQAIPSSM